jgi:hypothetical protein
VNSAKHSRRNWSRGAKKSRNDDGYQLVYTQTAAGTKGIAASRRMISQLGGGTA